VLARAPHAQAPSPARIVSTSPSITETLFALGLGPHVVGVSRYCRFPPEVVHLPKVGTFLQPDAERIVALRPDLVFVNSVASTLSHRLDAMHIRAVEVDDGAMNHVFDVVRQIAAAAGVAPRGDALVTELQAKLARIRETAAAGARRSVLFIIGRRPGTLADLVAVGPNSYIDSLIDIAGGRNVLSSTSLPQYPRISMETVLRLDPEVIIDTVDMGDTAAERDARRPVNERLWTAYGQLRAVKTRAVFADTIDALVVPGPRIVDAAQWLAGILARPSAGAGQR
jgi:iron complex transport system substrate-binding protein